MRREAKNLLPRTGRSFYQRMLRSRLCWRFALCLAAPLLAFAAGGPSPSAGSSLPTLTRAEDLRRLTPEEANRGYPVRLRAVVTYFGPHDPNLLPGERYSTLPAPDMFVQDSSAGIFVNIPRDAPAVRPGQILEIEGISEAPDFSPQIGKPRWKVVGSGALPVPKRVSFDHMASTAEDSQFVEVTGVVRTAQAQQGNLMLDVAISGGRLTAIIPELPNDSPASLTDAEVRLRGVCGALFNQKNQLIGVLLYVAGFDQFHVIRPAAANPFGEVVQPIASLQRFTPVSISDHRIHVRGAVSFQQPGSFLYVTDGRNGLRVESRQPIDLRSGDLVDVVGFPRLADFRPVLEDANVHLLGKAPPPKPLALTAKQLQEGDYDSDLVSIEANLLAASLLPNAQTLQLQAGGLTFEARMESPRPARQWYKLLPGSRLRVNAICTVLKDKYGRTQSFRLLIDEPEDIEILSKPSWWTLGRALQALGGMMLCATAGFVWIMMLRRRVKLQTAIIQERYQREAALLENYHRLFEHHPQPMCVYDLETFRFLAVNEAAIAHYGYSSEEFLEMTIMQIRAPEDLPRLMEELEQAEGGLLNSGICKHRKKDGSVVDVEIVSHDLIFAGRRARVAAAADVTEREKAKRLSQDRREIVELIARRCPVDQTMGKLVNLVENQVPGLAMSVLLLKDAQFFYLASSLPDTMVQQTIGVPTNLNGDARDSFAWKGAAPPTGTDPFWDAFLDASIRHGYRTCWSAPIASSSGRLLGAVVGCLRHTLNPGSPEHELLDMAAQLASVAIEQQLLHDQLIFQAHHDILTGLPNRVLLGDRLAQGLSRSRREGTSLGVLQIDLDRFKLINDCLGHAMGDTLLKSVAERLSHCVRQTDTLARVGGDEFTLLLTDLRKPEDAHRVAAQLLDTLGKPFVMQGNEIFVTSSIGIAFYPQDATDAGTLLKKADAAMYRAKHNGKNQWHGFSPEIAQVGNRLELENYLHRALERNEFEIVYQPLFNTATGSLASMEALLRWRHPRLGLVPPCQFIPIAEETGLIVPIGRWVMKQVCRDAQGWPLIGGDACKVSLNISAVQFAREDLVQIVSSTLEETGLDPSRLELEITESTVMQNIELSARQMAELRSLGVSIAIDDFGTGYSALSYLQQLPVDFVKIDQSFVREMSHGANPARLVQAIVRMAHGLGLKVTAEGIETQAQLTALRQFGCDQVQGFLLGRPRSLPDAPSAADFNEEAEAIELAS